MNAQNIFTCVRVIACATTVCAVRQWGAPLITYIATITLSSHVIRKVIA
jgi:hypothetical protein